MKKIRAPSLPVLYACIWLVGSLLTPGHTIAGAGLEKPVLPQTGAVESLGQTDYRWTLHNLNGEKIDFSVFKNHVVFLHFWATWCPHCSMQMATIQKLYESLPDKDGVRFVMASYEKEEMVKKYLAKKEVTLPIYLHGKSVPTVFGPQSRFPRTIIIDRNGQVVYKHIGGADWDDTAVRGFLEDML